MSERITRHVVARGRVQGVGYREFMRREAVRQGVAGWVRNRRDGRVEAMIAGPEAAVEAVIAWMRHGPPSAEVASLEVEPAEGDYEGFEVRRTE